MRYNIRAMARPPTAEEKARMARGPRYDPSRPRAPWGQRGGGDGGEIRAPTPEELALLATGPRYEGRPKTEPPPTLAPTTAWAIPGEPSAWDQFLQSLKTGWPGQVEDEGLEDWRRQVAAMQAQGQLPTGALTQAPIIPELGFEAWRGTVPPWTERGVRPPAEVLALEGSIRTFAQKYSAQTPITLPPDFYAEPSYEGLDEQQIVYLQQVQMQNEDAIRARAWGKAVFDLETGRQISWNEVLRLARTEPLMPIVEVLAMGGDIPPVELEGTINLLLQGYGEEGLQTLAQEEATGIKTKAEEQIEEQIVASDMPYRDKFKALWEYYGVPEGASTAQKKRATEMIEEKIAAPLSDRKAEILGRDITFEEKHQALLDLYGVPAGARSQTYYDLMAEVVATISPEGRLAQAQKPGKEPPTEKEQLKAAWEAQKRRKGWVEEWGRGAAKAPVGEGKLQGMLEPYGINVIGNYPWISPISEAHLMRLSPDVIEQMSRYLKQKGLSWREFLEISSSWYGGGGQGGRGRWEIPRQW